jgi:hypothetical protein
LAVLEEPWNCGGITRPYVKDLPSFGMALVPNTVEAEQLYHGIGQAYLKVVVTFTGMIR